MAGKHSSETHQIPFSDTADSRRCYVLHAAPATNRVCKTRGCIEQQMAEIPLVMVSILVRFTGILPVIAGPK